MTGMQAGADLVQDVDRRQGDSAAEPVVLRDGSSICVRSLQATDTALLADAFARLSPMSRRFRFLTGKRELSSSELRYFTDIDHHDHEALVAVDADDGRAVGVARFVRSAEDSRTAELALTVVDAWQRRGVATELLARLIRRARENGIFAFTALVAADNAAMVGLLRDRRAGVELIHIDAETLEYEVSLEPFESSFRSRAALTRRCIRS